MTQRTEIVYLEDDDVYVSQTRISMPLYKMNGQKWRGEERTFVTRDIDSVQLSSESMGWLRFLAVLVLILAAASAISGIFALALGNLDAGPFFLILAALMGAPIIIFRGHFFGRRYFATVYIYTHHGVTWCSGRRTRQREDVRSFVSAVGEALSSRDYGPAG